MDPDRADLVLLYALLCAGERDGGERELTATQLVKYAYLADLEHAARHASGETFTRAPWRFSQAGPHAPELEARIAPVVRRSGAVTRGVYYSLSDDERGLRRSAELALPAVVITAVARAVRAHVRDTNGLLAAVYATAPMRRAAPDALLDFGVAPASAAPTSLPAIAAAAASAPALALRQRARDALRARLAAARGTAPAPALAYAPRFDDACFAAGQRALDDAPRAVAACSGSLTIDPALWDAPARRERDVP